MRAKALEVAIFSVSPHTQLSFDAVFCSLSFTQHDNVMLQLKVNAVLKAIAPSNCPTSHGHVQSMTTEAQPLRAVRTGKVAAKIQRITA